MSTAPLSPSYYADFQGLDALKKSAREHDPKAVRQAARQFESLLTGMLLKSMRAAKLGDGLGDSQETAFYQDMLDQQVAVQLSQGKGLGLADMLVQQLTRSGLAAHPVEKQAAGPAAAMTPPPQAASAPAAPSPAAVLTPTAAAPVSVVTCGMGAVQAPTAPPAAAPVSVIAPIANASAGAASVPEQVAFVRQVRPFAERAAVRLGVTPDALIAHAALETGWGRHVPAGVDGASSFNMFGIKAGASWNGPSAASRTLEYDAGSSASMMQPFRSYASLEQCMNDYVNVLQGSPRFRAALATGSDTGAFAQGLAGGGYATDPAYGAKLTAVADRVRNLRDGPATEPVRMAGMLNAVADPTTFVSRQST